jgi:spore germination protein YaaH
MLIYGDFQYRNRPYDLKILGKIADKILLMAYDFHKSGGEPGPNFPFDSGSQHSPSLRARPSNINYGYDFKTMISDVLSVVPKEKIEVVFGMYGYDWTLNEQGTPLKGAKALSLNEIRALISNDKFQIVNQSQITNSKEKSIDYTDSEGQKHIVWYEDEESADIKIKYLQGQGISQVSFWALSYF